jgi:iron complex transport system substrate-binding protein
VPTLIYEPNGYATSGPFVDEVMAAAGLSDAAPGMNLTRSGTIPIEAVIVAAPRLLIFNRASSAAHSEAELVLRHPALAALAGGTSIATLTLTPLLCPGPWSVEVAPALARLGRAALARSTVRP